MKQGFLDRLQAAPVLSDGGYFRELLRLGTVRNLDDLSRVVLDHPDAVLAMHRQFARAGAELLQVVCLGARGLIPRDGRCQAAVRLARLAATEGQFVAGTLSQVPAPVIDAWGLLSANQRAASEAAFEWQIGEQVDAGVDVFVLETFDSVAQASAALRYVKQAGVQCVVTLAFGEDGFTVEAYSPSEAAKRLVDLGADVVGANCRLPPWELLPLVQEMQQAVAVPVCAQPAAFRTAVHTGHDRLERGQGAGARGQESGRPERWSRGQGSRARGQDRMVDMAPGGVQTAGTPYDAGVEVMDDLVVTPGVMASFARDARAAGVQLIGSCCGAHAYHVRAMAGALGKATSQPLPDATPGYVVAPSPAA